jgi:hypothetical protein
MNPRWFTSSTKVAHESSLAAVTLRFCGLSACFLIIAVFLFAILKGATRLPQFYTWAVPLVLWVALTSALFVGAMRAFANAPEKDTSTTLLNWCMRITLIYLLIPWLLKTENDVVWMITALLQILFMLAAIVFVMIARFSGTRLQTRDTLGLFITMLGGFIAIRKLVYLFCPEWLGNAT